MAKRKSPRKMNTLEAIRADLDVAGVPRGVGQERLPCGAIKPADDLNTVLSVPGGGAVSIQKPIPRSLVAERIKGMSPKQAFQELARSDIENGDFATIWERFKSKAKGGDIRSIQEYLDRILGKSTQLMSIAADVKVSMTDEDRKIIDSIRGVFGMREIVADVEARPIK